MQGSLILAFQPRPAPPAPVQQPQPTGGDPWADRRRQDGAWAYDADGRVYLIEAADRDAPDVLLAVGVRAEGGSMSTVIEGGSTAVDVTGGSMVVTVEGKLK